ncbi:hypothetical protein BN12_1080010 [Nostocoides japonicum T1-X7]|uniref:Right handed beta helix domain-containing protein n=2 Tax=Nostocoides japonicum TaxID=99481 RepID=A0A077LSQ3_9MICO|nr:hypothetical protein BN12_1080010 [Tetrasphaera japonica T1-X7]
MTGDMTSVPLRSTDRWTAARMQQGRVLLDTDWNLSLDGPARDTRQLAADTVGPAGVAEGSTAFQVALAGGVLTVGAGSMWVDGLLARNPADLSYADQPLIAPLPTSGTWVVYLDVFPEEVQAAEDGDLLDPALDGIDTTTRTRVGWRVRLGAAQTPTCGGATFPAAGSTGLLDVARDAAPVSPDPCAPPDDPRTQLPDGLLRIEVLDAGSESTARFAWSYANGSDALAATVAGAAVTLAPSRSIRFQPGDLVEVSALARREDRVDHGPLFSVQTVAPQAGGDLVTLAAPSGLTGNPPGTCLRRWDGETVGAAAAVTATLGGVDAGITFTAHSGSYEVGDWWGVRVRGSAADAVETLTAAPPDGIRHAFASLAVVDLGAGTVLTDCRPTFPPLTGLDDDCTCTVTAFPGDDLQAKLDLLPATGGELCLAAGRFELAAALTVTDKPRVVVTGVGPATVLAATAGEAALVATRCDDIEVTHLRVETSVPPNVASPPGDPGLLGGLSFRAGAAIRVHDVEVHVPDSGGRSQSAIYVVDDEQGTSPEVVEICGNRLEVGDQQVGILVASAGSARISDNLITLTPQPVVGVVNRLVARELGRFVAFHALADAGSPPPAPAPAPAPAPPVPAPVPAPRPAPGAAGGIRRLPTGIPMSLGRVVDLADGTKLAIDGSAQVRRVLTDFAKNVSATRLGSATNLRAEVARYAAAAVLEPHQAAIGTASGRFLAAAVQSSRAIGQGIVVGGSRAALVRIDGNVVGSCIEGIHVGVQARGQRRLTAVQVVIEGNTVGLRVPFFWGRQRHAVYVGNVARLTMTDNHAQLTRTGSQDGTLVDAVRIWGVLGNWIQVRGLDLTGPFHTGVVIRDVGPGPTPRRSLRFLSDVLNENGGAALDVPASFQSERCLP